MTSGLLRSLFMVWWIGRLKTVGTISKDGLLSALWMALEVSEKFAGYDYKANVGSLGITAIDVSEGCAPYSNYPPMKMHLKAMSGFRALFLFSQRNENNLWMLMYDQYPPGRDRFNFLMATLKSADDFKLYRARLRVFTRTFQNFWFHFVAIVDMPNETKRLLSYLGSIFWVYFYIMSLPSFVSTLEHQTGSASFQSWSAPTTVASHDFNEYSMGRKIRLQCHAQSSKFKASQADANTRELTMGNSDNQKTDLLNTVSIFFQK